MKNVPWHDRQKNKVLTTLRQLVCKMQTLMPEISDWRSTRDYLPQETSK
jgi:hypothetical protein